MKLCLKFVVWVESLDLNDYIVDNRLIHKDNANPTFWFRIILVLVGVIRSASHIVLLSLMPSAIDNSLIKNGLGQQILTDGIQLWLRIELSYWCQMTSISFNLKAFHPLELYPALSYLIPPVHGLAFRGNFRFGQFLNMWSLIMQMWPCSLSTCVIFFVKKLHQKPFSD